MKVILLLYQAFGSFYENSQKCCNEAKVSPVLESCFKMYSRASFALPEIAVHNGSILFFFWQYRSKSGSDSGALGAYFLPLLQRSLASLLNRNSMDLVWLKY